MDPISPGFIEVILLTIIIIALLGMTTAVFLWPPPSEVKIRKQRARIKEFKKRIEEVPKGIEDECGFTDYSKLGNRGPKNLMIWRRCDKCGKMYLRKSLTHQKDIDEYFCKLCVGLTEIYKGGI